MSARVVVPIWSVIGQENSLLRRLIHKPVDKKLQFFLTQTSSQGCLSVLTMGKLAFHSMTSIREVICDLAMEDKHSYSYNISFNSAPLSIGKNYARSSGAIFGGWLPHHFLSRKEHRIFVLRNYGNDESHPFPMENGVINCTYTYSTSHLGCLPFFQLPKCWQPELYPPDTDERIVSRITDNFRGNN